MLLWSRLIFQPSGEMHKGGKAFQNEYWVANYFLKQNPGKILVFAKRKKSSKKIVAISFSSFLLPNGLKSYLEKYPKQGIFFVHNFVSQCGKIFQGSSKSEKVEKMILVDKAK